jgi:hypothetical protein
MVAWRKNLWRPCEWRRSIWRPAWASLQGLPRPMRSPQGPDLPQVPQPTVPLLLLKCSHMHPDVCLKHTTQKPPSAVMWPNCVAIYISCPHSLPTRTTHPAPHPNLLLKRHVWASCLLASECSLCWCRSPIHLVHPYAGRCVHTRRATCRWAGGQQRRGVAVVGRHKAYQPSHETAGGVRL